MKITAQRYVILTIAIAIISCGMVAAFNFIADPYGAYRLFEFGKTQMAKPAIYRRVKLSKAYDLRQIKPEALVLGTSRSHVGLRTTHGGWGVPIGARYNAAFDGATTKEMYAYLLHAYAVRPLRQVILGLDTWQLTKGPAWTRPDFDPPILFQPGQPFHNASVYAADLSLLISTDTTKASIMQLRSAVIAQPTWLAPDGQRLGEVFFREVEPDFPISPGGYFRNVDRQEIGFMLDSGAPQLLKKNQPKNSEKPLSSFDYIGKIVAFCRDQKIDLRIYLTPVHAHQLEIVAELGGWPNIERGKRDLVDLLSKDAASNPSASPFPLYDFAGYSSVTTEPVPEPASRSEMQYYWDSSHFKQRVGDWVLDRLFEFKDESDPYPEDFGNILTPATIATVLENIRAGQIAYRRERPGDIEFIRSLIKQQKGGADKGS